MVKIKLIKQYLNQIKILAVAIIYFGSIGLAIWTTNQVVTGKQAKQDVEIITTQTENHNNDISTIEKDTANVGKKQRESKKRLADIPLVVPGSDCPDYAELWNKAVAVTNSVSFED
jgi:nucleoside diphosphate kinase